MWKGTAKLNDRVELLADGGLETNFNLTYGPQGMNLKLLTGEEIKEIGYISSDEKVGGGVVIPGAGEGIGNFSR